MKRDAADEGVDPRSSFLDMDPGLFCMFFEIGKCLLILNLSKDSEQ